MKKSRPVARKVCVQRLSRRERNRKELRVAGNCNSVSRGIKVVGFIGVTLRVCNFTTPISIVFQGKNACNFVNFHHTEMSLTPPDF